MYRQILVFSDVQGKSITWRLSAKKNVPLPKKIDVYRVCLSQIIWCFMVIMEIKTDAYEGAARTSNWCWEKPEARPESQTLNLFQMQS